MGQSTQLLQLLLFMQYLVIAVTANNATNDYLGLLSLKDELQNTPKSWVGADPCGGSWELINCTNSRVTSIILISMGLSGKLTSEIWQLSELQILDLSYNINITGQLPSSIGNLTKLVNLNLIGCSFSGLIPGTIGNLKLLSILSLTNNSFNGPIPASIGSLSQLYWLDLANNQLEGALPVSNATAPGLDMLLNAKHFHLENNKLSGNVPPKLFSSSMILIHLILRSNKLTGRIPNTLGLVQSLEVICFDRNSITGPVPSNLNNLVKVSELYLSNNNLSGPLASALVREIGRTNPKDYVKDTAGAENIGRFLVEIADRLPKLISTNIGILVPHFGGESYKIRNALVGVLGKLVAKAFKDDEGEVSSKSVRLRTKQAMLEILLERCRDVSAYTRSRVLQVWAELCEEHSVSIGLWNEVAEVAAGRLEDKSAIVRKSALNLLIMMLQHNPFGPQLRVASFEATLEQYKKKLNELEPDVPAESVEDDLPSDNDTCNENGEVHNIDARVLAEEQQESSTDSCLTQMEEEIIQKDNSVPDVGNLEQTRALVASLEAGLRFSKCVSATMPTLVQLMASSSASDVENTILLLMRCKQFQIDGSEACLRKMLPLVFSQDKSIYEAVENAFVTIYIRKNPVETAKNLLSLAIDSNIGDLAALEFIVAALVSKGDISTGMISALWDFFCFSVSGTTAEQSRGALSVLCMAAKSSPVILGSHLQDIIDIGFGRWAKVDPLLARAACFALQRLSDDDKKKLLSVNGSRVFGMLESLIAGSWLPENIWYAAADKAIAAIYTIHPTPETLAADVVKKSLSSVFDCSGGDELHNDIDSGSASILTTVQVAKLSRYLFITSHVAMNQLLYVESCARKIQKQRAAKEKADIDRHNLQSNGMTPADTLKDNNINAELGLAASADAMLDTLSDKAEKEIISGNSSEKNLIGHCAPFLSKLCRNFSLMQKYPELQASGMLALCRFMIIDAKFCDANLQLLFTVVENASSETVRSNCTIALGDLAVRFPNLLEPWTENMYARLQDASVSVRKNAVLVLSHLILNDMMKVKGYINEMAIQLEDEEERISSLAKLFFHELSKKGSNPIYNLLPDILGKLSIRNLKRESFCNIMQFLIASIKKDKQMEALVEKLCNRFNGVTDITQWEYISYCLSQLTFTEKGMKKLMESFKTYEHALSEESVMDHFKNIINKSKKFAKPELKSCIEEFEDKLNKFHVEKKEQEVTARNAQIHQQRFGSTEGLPVSGNNGEDGAESDTEGATKSRAKKSSMKDQKGNVSASTKRSIRSKRR